MSEDYRGDVRGVPSRGVSTGRRRMVVGVEGPRERYYRESRERVDGEGDVLVPGVLVDDFNDVKGELFLFSKSLVSMPTTKRAISDVRRQIIFLIKALKELDLENIQSISRTFVSPLVWGGVRAGTGCDILDPDSEISEIFRCIHERALRASNIVTPNDSVYFQSWVVENTTNDSLKRAIFQVLGQKLVGVEFFPEDIQERVKELTGCEYSMGVIRTTLRNLRRDFVGGEFGVKARKTGKTCGKSVSLVSSKSVVCRGGIDGEEAKVMVWGRGLYDSAETESYTSRVMGIILAQPLDEEVDSREILRLLGCVDADQDTRNKVLFSPLSRLTIRNEQVWGDKLGRVLRGKNEREVRDILKKLAAENYIVRKIKKRAGSHTKTRFVVKNRLKAMEDWIGKISSVGSNLEKILWKMFEFGVGEEFTNAQLAVLLAEEWEGVTPDKIRWAMERVGGRMGIQNAARGSAFEVEVRRGDVGGSQVNGLLSQGRHYRIRP